MDFLLSLPNLNCHQHSSLICHQHLERIEFAQMKLLSFSLGWTTSHRALHHNQHGSRHSLPLSGGASHAKALYMPDPPVTALARSSFTRREESLRDEGELVERSDNKDESPKDFPPRSPRGSNLKNSCAGCSTLRPFYAYLCNLADRGVSSRRF